MSNIRIGVFGCGNMGSALVIAIRAHMPKASFFLFTPSKSKASELALVIGGTSLEQSADMPKNLDWYILAFKPQNIDGFQFDFPPTAKIISILAGVNLSKLTTKFKVNKIARLMPNTPTAIGLGANLLFLNSHFTQTENEEINSLLSKTGKVFPMKSEEDLDLTTGFSGCGPALVFEVARIFEVELNRMTKGRVSAKEIIAQTFFGSTSLMNNVTNSEKTFEELRRQVTSEKGVTFEALEILKKHSLEKIFSSAFEAAYKRTIELSK